MGNRALGVTDPSIQTPQENRVHPSKRTLQRWQQREDSVGHCLPHVMNGDKPASVVHGHLRLMLLSFFRMCCPKATAPEVNAFLFDTAHPNF